jgi:hypothetical protein
MQAPHDATVLDNGDAHCASTVAAVVGGLEVNGGERGHSSDPGRIFFNPSMPFYS